MEIIFIDDSLLVVNKPSGLLSIQDGYNPDLPTVKNVLEPEYGRCWVVHRLDKETSGVFIMARTAEVHRILNDQFSEREVTKEYQSVTFGVFTEKAFRIELPLRIDGDRKHRTVVGPEKGKKAVTNISVLNMYKGFSFVTVKPATGYTHQIRAHLWAIDHPIIGDKLYTTTSDSKLPIWIDRLALHAQKVTLRHPITKEIISFIAQPPDDFSSLISQFK
jgi:tRNA pseudouridine32 synthase / 23S rRNA pseudouridine746 synthase